MSLSQQTNVDLTGLNTLGITATAESLSVISDPADLGAAVKKAGELGLPIFPLGGGSNIVLGQTHLPCAVIKLEIKGREITSHTDGFTEVRVGAGENWDELVEWSVSQGLRGIESLSLIPGTVGAAPVQNIGAYGQELHETLINVEAYDVQKDEITTLSNVQCRFSYRNSMFKHEGRDRYIVTAITLRLVPAELAPPPSYASLQAELDRRGIERPTVSQIRDAVIAVRRSKLPDPAVVPTAGSFFHNPIITAEKLHELQNDYPQIPFWPAPEGKIKLAAGWLVEQCGLKGHQENGVGLYDKQAIALINPGHRSAPEVLAFRDKVIKSVEDKFGVTLNMEPELIRF